MNGIELLLIILFYIFNYWLIFLIIQKWKNMANFFFFSRTSFFFRTIDSGSRKDLYFLGGFLIIEIWGLEN